MWPKIGGYLIEGAKGADEALNQGLEDIARELARVWVILDDNEPLAAFLTAVVVDDRGRAVDVYGLAGRSILKWGPALADQMVEYAKDNDCQRVIFKGRPALARAYPDVEIVGQETDGTLIYERRVA